MIPLKHLKACGFDDKFDVSDAIILILMLVLELQKLVRMGVMALKLEINVNMSSVETLKNPASVCELLERWCNDSI